MDKKINIIAYIIIAFTLFNFFYGFLDHIQGFDMWHWYLIILSVTISVLLFIKVKRMKMEQELAEINKKHEEIRMKLKQKDDLQKLYQSSDEQFAKTICDLYKLEGIDDFELCEAVEEKGYNLIFWVDGNKTVVKWFKQKPLSSSATDVVELVSSTGEFVKLTQVREFLGVAKDYDIQADEAVILTTTRYSDDVMEFANRNQITLIDGPLLIERIRKVNELQILSE